MRPTVILCLLLSAPALRADEAGDAVARGVAEKYRNSIARVLVSRSPAYHTAPFWGKAPLPDRPDVLGTFDVDAAKKAVPDDAADRDRILRTIAAHDLRDPANVPESFGSGIVLDKSGLILTNAHVVKDATRVYVRLPGKRGSWADIHASDPRSDLAVLRLLDPPADLVEVPLADDAFLREGQAVVSMTNPYTPGFRAGDAPEVRPGTVTALRTRPFPPRTNEFDRTRVTLHHYGTLIQADADKSGCSGGALFDAKGKVVGLSNALVAVGSGKGDSYAVPVDAGMRRIIDVLRKGEEVEYGFLGVVLSQAGRGVVLQQVTLGSPAALGGLRDGDRVVKIDGHPIRDNDDLFLRVAMVLSGRVADVVVAGAGGERTCKVRMAKSYVPGPVVAAKRPPARFGLRVDYTSILTQRNPFGIRRWPPPGVVIREVVSGGPADLAGLQPDKLVTHVGKVAVTNPAEYYRAIAAVPGASVTLAFLTSDGKSDTVTLTEKK